MSRDEDRDLREMFARSRDDDRRGARDFQTIIAASHRRPAGRAFRPAMVSILAAAVMLVAVYVALRPRPSSPERAAPAMTLVVDPRSTHWDSPTDFLLSTPADSLLRALPTLRYLDRDFPSLTPPPLKRPARRAGRFTS